MLANRAQLFSVRRTKPVKHQSDPSNVVVGRAFCASTYMHVCVRVRGCANGSGDGARGWGVKGQKMIAALSTLAQILRACLRVCVRPSVRAAECACSRACVRSCVRVYVWSCVGACVPACVLTKERDEALCRVLSNHPQPRQHRAQRVHSGIFRAPLLAERHKRYLSISMRHQHYSAFQKQMVVVNDQLNTAWYKNEYAAVRCQRCKA